MANTIDPLGGSYFVEALTDEMEQAANDYIKKIDDMGGMLGAIENGFVFREIQESSIKFQNQVESGEKIIVGLNKFVMPEEDDLVSRLNIVECAVLDPYTREAYFTFNKRLEQEFYSNFRLSHEVRNLQVYVRH